MIFSSPLEMLGEVKQKGCTLAAFIFRIFKSKLFCCLSFIYKDTLPQFPVEHKQTIAPAFAFN